MEFPRATMRAVRVLTILILLCPALHAETPSEAVKRRRLEYPELTRIVELAQSAPAEFAARALLRVAQAANLKDQTWKRELLDQAFQTAASSRSPVRRHIGPGANRDDSRERMIGEAGNLGLDRLSLQTDAVKAMLAVNSRHARELFLAIPQPVPARLHCEDALLDDPSAYFATAAAIAAAAFTPAERKRDDVALFLDERVQRIASAVELAPAIQMISSSSSRMTAAQIKLLASSLAVALQRIGGDDRSFSSSLPAISKEMASLNGSELAEAYRELLVRNLSGLRCADSDYVAFKLEDIKPSKIDAKAILTYPNRKGEEDLLKAKLMPLLFGPGHSALTDEQKSTPEWREQFSDLLHDIEGIKPANGESEALFYYRKGAALDALLIVTPHGETRDRILQEYIAFLKASNLQQDSLIEWFSMVEKLAGETRSMNAGEYKKMLDAFDSSGHTVLSLYARIEKMLPTAPSWAQTAQ
jgi:hypothetical protein